MPDMRLAIPWWDLALRAAVFYLVLLAAMRLFGKREVGQFTVFDLVMVLLVANAVQPAMTGPDSSILGGLVIVTVLFVLNALLARLRFRSPLVRRLLEGQPRIIARDGRWIPEALRREGLEPEDCLMAMREHGIGSVSEIGLAVLETDGTISFIPADAPMHRGKRRVRTRRI